MKVYGASLVRVRAVATRVRPWVLVAAFLAALLLGYYALLGVRFWTTSRQVSALTEQTARISALVREQQSGRDERGPALPSQEERLGELRGRFTYDEADALLAAISAAASEAAVKLNSITVGDTRSVTEGDVRYEGQVVTVALQGTMPDLQRFFSLLHERTPIVAISSVRIVGLDGLPSAQVQLLFHLRPEAAPPKKQATATPQAKP